jgi:hypothetical protein
VPYLEKTVKKHEFYPEPSKLSPDSPIQNLITKYYPSDLTQKKNDHGGRERGDGVWKHDFWNIKMVNLKKELINNV